MVNLFEFVPTVIPEVIVIRPNIFQDERGLFIKFFERGNLTDAGISFDVVEELFSVSKRNVLRGLHFLERPYEQAKIVRCLRGEIFDVAVDIRKGSPTFGKHVSTVISEANRLSVYIPRGFAHGFTVLGEMAEVNYLTDNKYSPEADRGIIWNDPDVGIKWPVKNPILSVKDSHWPTIREYIR